MSSSLSNAFANMVDEPSRGKYSPVGVGTKSSAYARDSILSSASNFFQFCNSNNKRASTSDVNVQVGDHYEAVSIVTVRANESLESEATTQLSAGATFEIIKVGENPRRVKIQAGNITGWISVKTSSNESLIVKVREHRGKSSKLEAMFKSARCGDLAAMQKIVEMRGVMSTLARPNLNCSDVRGMTALMYASLFGNKNIVDYLLTKRALVETRDQNGCTPLMFAVANGHVAIARVLLEVGACVNVHDSKNRTPLDYAKNFGYYEMVELLKEYGAENVDSEEEEYEDNEACHSKFTCVANVSRLSPEHIQVRCTSRAGDLGIWSVERDVTLNNLREPLLENTLVREC